MRLTPLHLEIDGQPVDLATLDRQRTFARACHVGDLVTAGKSGQVSLRVGQHRAEPQYGTLWYVPSLGWWIDTPDGPA